MASALKRKLREVADFEVLPEELPKKEWTGWKEIIKPTITPEEESKGWRGRRENWYTNSVELKKLKESIDGKSGIYELRLNKEGKTCVVYIGSSCAEGGLYTRLSQYVRNGDHKAPLIQIALSEGATIEARACTYKDCETAQARENEVLAKFDYLWNIRNNQTPRKKEASATALNRMTVYQ